jgi:peroxiredoxin
LLRYYFYYSKVAEPMTRNGKLTHKRNNAKFISSSVSSASKLRAIGEVAPDFTLRSTPDQSLSLKDFRGRPVIVAFYPADFSPVCGDEMALFNEILPEFHRFNAQVLGISVDNIWSHLAFAKDHKLRFPLLSDFHPKGDVARKFGVYRQDDGTSERALFVIDSKGIVRWNYVSPLGVNPGVDGVLTALESMNIEYEKKEEGRMGRHG